jgi:hypothetical protein
MWKLSDRSARRARSLLLACICGCSNQRGSDANGAAGHAATAGGNESGGGGNSASGATASGGGGGPQGGTVGAAGGGSAGEALGGAAGDALPDAGTAGASGGGAVLKMVVTRTVAPSRLVSLGSGHYFIEFPAAAFGTIDIAIAATSSAAVTLKFGEKKVGDAVDANPGGDVTYKLETLTVTPGTKTYRITQHPTLGFFARPDKLFATIPFRYVEVSAFPGTLTAAYLRTRSRRLPITSNPVAWPSAFTAHSMS